MTITKILQSGASSGASDLHLYLGSVPIFRIDGELLQAQEMKDKYGFSELNKADLDGFIEELLPSQDRELFHANKDLDSVFEFENVRYRFNFSYQKQSIGIVARVIQEKEPTLDEIGMPPVIKKMLEYKQGLVLVTGPTGCGKSTTLAAMINEINANKRVNIITLEDPTEFIFKPKKSIISQRQLGQDMKSFASALKHILRQDPDVIMLGEMRDLESIAAALTLAETGHLVLATLHTYSAPQTVDRIIDVFPPHQQGQVRAQLSMVLRAVISQRLLPRLGGGRVAAKEILINNFASANLIREGKIAQLITVLETGQKQGMKTLEADIAYLYQEGILSLETAQGYLPQLSEDKNTNLGEQKKRKIGWV